jgi:hypothetical protein
LTLVPTDDIPAAIVSLCMIVTTAFAVVVAAVVAATAAAAAVAAAAVVTADAVLLMPLPNTYEGCITHIRSSVASAA